MHSGISNIRLLIVPLLILLLGPSVIAAVYPLHSGTTFDADPAYVYLFNVENRRWHMIMTAMVASSMALVIVLVIALDRPFRGELSITTDAYTNAFASIGEVAPSTEMESKTRR